MYLLRKLGSTSNVFRVKLRSSATGQGLTGLSSSSTGLIISTICDNEASATAYTAAGSTIETITTLGTFADPTASKCRFKEVDATNHQGVYEIQLANARFSVASAKTLRVSISGATNLLEKDLIIQLSGVDVESVAGTAQTAGDILGTWTPTKAGYVDAAISTRGTLTQTQVTGGAWDVTHWFGAKGGLPILDASTGLILQGYGAGGITVGTVTALTGYVSPPSAATIAGAVLDEAKGSHTGLLAGVALDSTVAKDATVSKPGTAQTITAGQSVVASNMVTLPSKYPASLDWSADVTNKPTIGTSTLDAAGVWGYTSRVLTANTNLGLPSWPASWNWNTVTPDAAGTAAGLISGLQSHGDSTWATATGFATAANLATLTGMTESSGGHVRWLATALEEAPSGSIDAAGVRAAIGMEDANMDTQLAGILAASTPPGGAFAQAVTVHDSDGLAIPNARCAIYSGTAPNYVLVDVANTNTSGVCAPTADAGSYTLIVTAAGYASSTQALSVTGHATVSTSTLQRVSVTPSDPPTTTGWLLCLGATGQPLAGVSHTLQTRLQPSTGGLSLYGTERTATSGADGVVQWLGLVDGSEVRWRRGTGEWVAATVDASKTTWSMEEGAVG